MQLSFKQHKNSLASLDSLTFFAHLSDTSLTVGHLQLTSDQVHVHDCDVMWKVTHQPMGAPLVVHVWTWVCVYNCSMFGSVRFCPI